MRITVNLKDELINHASKLTGINEKTALINAGLEALIGKYSSERLTFLAVLTRVHAKYRAGDIKSNQRCLKF